MPKPQPITDVRKHWTSVAKKLVGRKIVDARYLSREEAEALDWYQPGVVLQLDDGTLLWSQADDEGNGPGALGIQSKSIKETLLPVLFGGA